MTADPADVPVPGSAGSGRPGRQRIERARIAVAAVFGTAGLSFSSWVSRTPAVRDGLDLTSAQLGLLLFCLSAGAVAALPLSGPFVHRVGPARAALTGGLAIATGLVLLAAGMGLTAVPLAGLGLLIAGMGTSSCDVAINVEGADVERRLGRTLMPRFHAGFSLGTVAGALLGAGCAAVGVPAGWQYAVTAAIVAVVLLVATRHFTPVPDRPSGLPRRRSGVLGAWREPRTLLIGVLVFAFAFVEGVANDWIAIGLVDGYDAGDAIGAVGFGVFVAAMTGSRMVGGWALARWGRVTVLRATAGLAGAGLLLVVLGPTLPWAILGALIWGVGAALGFPVGMSAAADDPDGAAVRVSVVSSIGYTSFLAGPPLVGFLADEIGIRRALLVVLIALLLALIAAGGTRRPRAAPPLGTPGDAPCRASTGPGPR